MHKKGQAALEFLSTYGFAFLIILVMIGALSYFGVLNPKGLIPNRCLIPSEFSCEEYRLTRAGGNLVLDIVLTNNLGNAIDFNTTVGGYNVTAQGKTADPVCTFVPATATSGQRSTIQCTTAGTWPAVGEKFRVQFDYKYRQLGNTFWVPARAEVLTSIQ